MSLIYSENFSGYANGTDVDPGVPNWVFTPQGLLPSTAKVQPGLGGKYADVQPFPGEFADLAYNVVFAQPYQELRARCIADSLLAFFYIHSTAPQVFAGGYIFIVTDTAWNIGYAFPNAATIIVASGSVTVNMLDFKIRMIMAGSVFTGWINDVQIPGATYDFSAVGDPFPSGRFANLSYSEGAGWTNIELHDSPVVTNAALLDSRRRK